MICQPSISALMPELKQDVMAIGCRNLLTRSMRAASTAYVSASGLAQWHCCRAFDPLRGRVFLINVTAYRQAQKHRFLYPHQERSTLRRIAADRPDAGQAASRAACELP